jgi:hypothetical protein
MTRFSCGRFFAGAFRIWLSLGMCEGREGSVHFKLLSAMFPNSRSRRFVAEMYLSKSGMCLLLLRRLLVWCARLGLDLHRASLWVWYAKHDIRK